MTLRNYFRLVAEGRYRGPGIRVLMFFLQLLSWVYRLGIQMRRKFYEWKIWRSKKLPIPVISVGNITWGGVGKTPITMHLSRFFLSEGRTPLILTRGYGKDEIREYAASIPDAPVGVGKDRVKAATDILKFRSADVALLDDGFQHWRIQRDLDIVVVSAVNPFGNRLLIPAGILREKLPNLRRADIIIFNDVNLISRKTFEEIRNQVKALAPKAELMEAQREPLYFYMGRTKERLDLSRLKGRRVTTFSGVGTPRSFQLLISKLGLKTIRNFEFCDHHDFSEEELREIAEVKESSQSDYVVTTEKDFLRKENLIASVLNPLILKVSLRITVGDGILKDRLRKALSHALPVI